LSLPGLSADKIPPNGTQAPSFYVAIGIFYSIIIIGGSKRDANFKTKAAQLKERNRI
jgi:hypothetical protein